MTEDTPNFDESPELAAHREVLDGLYDLFQNHAESVAVSTVDDKTRGLLSVSVATGSVPKRSGDHGRRDPARGWWPVVARKVEPLLGPTTENPREYEVLEGGERLVNGYSYGYADYPGVEESPRLLESGAMQGDEAIMTLLETVRWDTNTDQAQAVLETYLRGRESNADSA